MRYRPQMGNLSSLAVSSRGGGGGNGGRRRREHQEDAASESESLSAPESPRVSWEGGEEGGGEEEEEDWAEGYAQYLESKGREEEAEAEERARRRESNRSPRRGEVSLPHTSNPHHYQHRPSLPQKRASRGSSSRGSGQPLPAQQQQQQQQLPQQPQPILQAPFYPSYPVYAPPAPAYYAPSQPVITMQQQQPQQQQQHHAGLPPPGAAYLPAPPLPYFNASQAQSSYNPPLVQPQPHAQQHGYAAPSPQPAHHQFSSVDSYLNVPPGSEREGMSAGALAAAELRGGKSW